MTSFEDKQYHKKLLELEGIECSDEFKVNLKKYLWDIKSIENIQTVIAYPINNYINGRLTLGYWR